MTIENVEERLKKHNSHYHGSKYTCKALDCEIFVFIKWETPTQALKTEKHIKAMKSKIYIENLNKYP